MSTRDDKCQAVLDLALQLILGGRRMTFGDLTLWLNNRGLRTNRGQPFQSGRGVARLISAAYAYARDDLGLGDAGAAPIAQAFTNRHGHYSYE